MSNNNNNNNKNPLDKIIIKKNKTLQSSPLLDVSFRNIMCGSLETYDNVSCGAKVIVSKSLCMPPRKIGKISLDNGFATVYLADLTDKSHVFLTNNGPKGTISKTYYADLNVKEGMFFVCGEQGDYSDISWIIIDS